MLLHGDINRQILPRVHLHGLPISRAERRKVPHMSNIHFYRIFPDDGFPDDGFPDGRVASRASRAP